MYAVWGGVVPGIDTWKVTEVAEKEELERKNSNPAHVHIQTNVKLLKKKMLSKHHYPTYLTNIKNHLKFDFSNQIRRMFEMHPSQI